MKKSQMPPCPRCGTARHVTTRGEFYHCGRCDGHFDDTPDEGGDYSADPSRRLERREEREWRRDR